MKLKEVKKISLCSHIVYELQDLMKWGFRPQRQGLTEDSQYEYPPFYKFNESGETHLPIKWRQTQSGIFGVFSTLDHTYEIQIESFTYKINDQIYQCANIAFVTIINGQPTTELVPTKYPNQVFGTFMNGVGEKVIMFNIDAITMVATNNVEKRMSLYNRLADKYLTKFGNVYKNIKTNTGLVTVIISHNIPKQIQPQLYQYLLDQSYDK